MDAVYAQVYGKGRIRDHLMAYLKEVGFCMVPEDDQGAPELKPVSHRFFAVDDWEPIYEDTELARIRERATPFVPVLGRMDQIYIGPMEEAGALGCAQCVSDRWEHATRRNAMITMLESRGKAVRIALSGRVSTESIQAACEAALSLYTSYVARPGKRQRDCSVAVIGQPEVQMEWQPLIPVDGCRGCGANRPESWPLTQETQSAAMSKQQSLDLRGPDGRWLQNFYFHANVGLVSAKRSVIAEEDLHAINVFSHMSGVVGQIAGYGVGQTSDEATAKAILEVLERGASLRMTQREPFCVASVEELDRPALMGSSFGCHSDEVYEAAHSPYTRFSPDTRYAWVTAVQWNAWSPILVPLQATSSRLHLRDASRFIQETSNGCAVGVSYKDAILRGLLEVIERDGLLNTWYGQIPLPEVKLGSDIPDQLQKWVQRFALHGYHLRMFDMSLDMGLPNVLVVALRQDQGFPATLCGACASVDPLRAALHAMEELYSSLVALTRISSSAYASLQSLWADLKAVRRIEDHAGVAALSQAQRQWDFLLDPARTREGSEFLTFTSWSDSLQLHTSHVGTILNDLTSRLEKGGYPVLVVDQTTTELASGKLQAVKVIVPGLTPLAFGYGMQRVYGLSRVLDVPYALGYRDKPLTVEQLNPFPHPLS